MKQLAGMALKFVALKTAFAIDGPVRRGAERLLDPSELHIKAPDRFRMHSHQFAFLCMASHFSAPDAWIRILEHLLKPAASYRESAIEALRKLQQVQTQFLAITSFDIPGTYTENELPPQPDLLKRLAG
jgi:hypothetical protein